MANKERGFNEYWYDNFILGTGGSFNKNDFWVQRTNRHFNFNCTHMFLYNLCVTMFKWNNLPEQSQPIDSLYLNKVLITQGRALFYKEEETGLYRVQPYSPAGKTNNYGWTPIRQIVSNFFGRAKSFTPQDSVEIWHNPSQFPMTTFIHEYCRKLQLFDEVIFNRLKLHKVPFTVSTTGEDERLAAKEVLRLWEEGLEIKMGKGKTAGDYLKVDEFDITYIISNLLKDKQTILSEFLTFVGINSFAFEKQERITNQELHQNDEVVARCLSIYLKTLNHCCDLINKKFGLNISVELDTDYAAHMNFNSMGVYDGSDAGMNIVKNTNVEGVDDNG